MENEDREQVDPEELRSQVEREMDDPFMEHCISNFTGVAILLSLDEPQCHIATVET